MHTTSLAAVVALLMMSACSNSAKDNQFYVQLDSTIVQSNEILKFHSSGMMRSLENKVSDPVSSEKASYWWGKANRVFICVSTLADFLNSSKAKLSENNSRFTGEENVLLQKKLQAACDTLFVIDSSLTAEFSSQLTSLKKKFTALDLTDVSPVQASLAFSKLQADIYNVQDMLLRYCDIRTTVTIDGYDMVSMIAYGESKIYHPGDIGIIYAGLGMFTGKPVPEVSIDGKRIERTPVGNFEYTFKVPAAPGKYKKTVVINYIDWNTGQPARLKKEIDYSVEAQCQ